MLNNLIGKLYTMFIVFLPKVHFTKHGIDSPFCNASSAEIPWVGVRCLWISLKSILTHCFEWGNQGWEHRVEVGGRKCHRLLSLLLAVILITCLRVRNVTECAYEIEIAKWTDGCYLRYISLQLCFCIWRINFGNAWGIFQDGVTFIDNTIEILPFGIVVVGCNVFLQHFFQITVLMVGIGINDVLRTILTPYHHTADNGFWL